MDANIIFTWVTPGYEHLEELFDIRDEAFPENERSTIHGLANHSKYKGCHNFLCTFHKYCNISFLSQLWYNKEISGELSYQKNIRKLVQKIQKIALKKGQSVRPKCRSSLF